MGQDPTSGNKYNRPTNRMLKPKLKIRTMQEIDVFLSKIT